VSGEVDRVSRYESRVATTAAVPQTKGARDDRADEAGELPAPLGREGAPWVEKAPFTQPTQGYNQAVTTCPGIVTR
jgi:hypothetical protein